MKFNPEKASATLALLALLTFARPSPAPAQLPAGTATGFSTAEHFPAPHLRQMKFQLTGDEASPQGGGKMFIKQPRLKNFRTNGEVVLIIEAPDCIYDSGLREASSPGHLRVQSGDGKFSIEGDGFLWRGDISTVLISNNITSSLRRPATNTATGQPKAPLIVTSKHFEFNLDTRTGFYRGDVAGEDEENEFSSGNLTISASTNGQVVGQSFDRLVAEPDASIRSKLNDGRTASARQMIYTRATESVELIGKATWKQGLTSGRADQATFRQSDNSIDAIGNVAMKLPREAVGLGGFFDASTNAPAKTASKNPALVDVFANRFQFRSNAVSSVAIGEGSVRVVDSTNTLACDKLTVQSFKNAATNDTATAEKDVVVIQGSEKQRIRSQRAVYTKADERIVFTGSPDWKLDPSEGQAQQLTIHKPTGEFRATGGVTATVTVDGKQGGLNLFPQSSDTNQTTRVIHFSGREMRSRDRMVTLLGAARANQAPLNGSEPRLRSDVIEARFGTNGQAMEYMQARNNVVYEQGTVGVTNGPNAHRRMDTMKLTAITDPKSGALSNLVAEGGVQITQFNKVATGAQAHYSGVTKLMELTGNPTLITDNVRISDATKLTWDEGKSKFFYEYPYKTEVWLNGRNPQASKTNVAEKGKP